jgi:RHS repeat-associated protein
VDTDHLGAPLRVRNQAGQLVWRWDGIPFAENLPDQDPSGLGPFVFNLRLPGQYFDQETGLHYNYFRDYDPATGRYLQSDPIGLAGGLNTYLYADANPLGNVDPEGLQKSGLPSTWGTPYTPPRSTSAPRYDPKRDAMEVEQYRQTREAHDDPLVRTFGARRVCNERSCQVSPGGVCTPSNPTGRPLFSTGPFMTAPGESPIGCPCVGYTWVAP